MAGAPQPTSVLAPDLLVDADGNLQAIPFMQLPPMPPLDPYQEQRLRRRLAALELSRSTVRALILDSEPVVEPAEVRRSRFGGPMSAYESSLDPVE